MNMSWTLRGRGERLLRLTYRQEPDPHATLVSPIFTVGDVCRQLGKSRRQVYRYLHAGRLQPCVRVLGQWLFATSEVDRVERTAVPRRFRRFFWDVRIADLSVDQHQDFILGRLLEDGDRQALHWLVRTYSRETVAAFLKGRGVEVLSRRAWQFWSVYVGLPVRERMRPSWRQRGRSWGGIE